MKLGVSFKLQKHVKNTFALGWRDTNTFEEHTAAIFGTK
jgi:hypothetical protein